MVNDPLVSGIRYTIDRKFLDCYVYNVTHSWFVDGSMMANNQWRICWLTDGSFMMVRTGGCLLVNDGYN